MCIHCRTATAEERQTLDLDLAFPSGDADDGMDMGNVSPLSWEDLDFFHDLPEADMGPDFAIPSMKSFPAARESADIPNYAISLKKENKNMSYTSDVTDEEMVSDDGVSIHSAPVSIFSENPDPMALGFAPRVYGATAPMLPSPKGFSFYVAKTSEMVREEKLAALDPFFGALNEGDLFSLYTLCQSQCAPNVLFQSKSCGFQYCGNMAVTTFWTLLFEKHYHGRIQLLSSRINSSVTSRLIGKNAFLPDSGVFETAQFVVKLDGSRMSDFTGFGLYRDMMNSGVVSDNLSLPELIRETEFFYQQHLARMMADYQLANMTPTLKKITYLFEITLGFHALNHTITTWNFELIGVEVSH